jgi:PiT family inorganic phosphate transporter
LLSALLILAACCVAFTNGANANVKGVASLHGSGTARFKTAILWGTLTTFLGAITAVFASRGLLEAFNGKGLVPDALIRSPAFVLAVASGGAGTSFLATRFGFPVSTTHALTGALVGAGLSGGDRSVHLAPLVKTFVMPLLVSPLLAVAAGAVICIVLKSAGLAPDHRTHTLDALHFLSGGATSFARGLNDTPKIAALLLVVDGFDIRWGIALVAVAMALGGLLDARRVGKTLAKKITGMNPGEGFAGKLATALLVTTANWNPLPVSTTHVSVGSLAGIGIVTRRAHWLGIGQIVLSWLVTLPCAAALAAVAAWFFGGAG